MSFQIVGVNVEECHLQRDVACKNYLVFEILSLKIKKKGRHNKRQLGK